MARNLALQLALCACVVAAMPFSTDDNHITIIDQGNIDTAVAEFPKLIVEFYAPVGLPLSFLLCGFIFWYMRFCSGAVIASRWSLGTAGLAKKLTMKNGESPLPNSTALKNPTILST